MIYIILFSLAAYLIGSLNTSVIVSKKVYKKDIRNEGSGNAGATNALRIFGKKTAALVFFFDFLKGFVAVMIAKYLIIFLDAPYECVLFAGFFVQVGHCFPIYFNFKGGKGVATAAGVASYIMPVVAIILLSVFAIISLSTKIASVASGVCASVYPLLAYFLADLNPKIYFIFAAACSALIIILHASNFARLIDGKEKPVTNK